MNGQILSDAVKVLSRSGFQIENLMDKCVEQICDKISKANSVYCRPQANKPEFLEISDADWVVSGEFINIALYEKNKKKPSAHIAIKAVLCDEEDSSVANWQPAIYVMFDRDYEKFECDSIKLRGKSSEDLEKDAVNSKLLVWNINGPTYENSTGWMFIVPLVKINNQDDIDTQIVEPAIKLISGEGNMIFPDDSIAFNFKLNESKKIDIVS